jgi:hypothetical protein
MKRHLHVVALVLCVLSLLYDLVVWGALPRVPEVGEDIVASANREAPLAATYILLGNPIDSALAPLMTWGFWVPVVVFFIGFWLLGAFINRGRWGLWVVFGIIVGVFAYGGHILGQLFEAPFWLLSASEANELVTEQMLAPLAIAAFVFARELTIWFGAWVARSGARKTELNAEAQREYERTLEAGPTLSR